MYNLETLQHSLHSENWNSINQALLGKILAEFMYEELIEPQVSKKLAENKAVYKLTLKSDIHYQFIAKSNLFNSYHVFPETIQRQEKDLDWQPGNRVLQFLLELHETISMNPVTTAYLLREMSNTLLADAHIYAQKKRNKTNILELNYSQIEGEMEGHPWIIFNKGRIGFNYQDYLNYAPEQKQPISFLWIAARHDQAKFNAVSQLSYEKLLEEELGFEKTKEFKFILESQGLCAENYYFFPVHPWQWQNNLVTLFAEEIATQAIVPLTRVGDCYLPQQSIRTFLNISYPQKRNIKLPISILNTSTYRGLPGTVLAPYMTEWLKNICQNDPFLTQECRLILLGEVAGIQYFHPYYMNLEGVPYQFREMLGCLWRESIFSFLEADEKPLTLAALLHQDYQGKPFVFQLVEQSGLTLSQWLERLFKAVLPPLLHYLYRYGTVFSPHGENVILVLQNSVPVRVALKDFLDDVNISCQPLPELETFPKEIKLFFPGEKDEKLCQYIFTGLFICHFRYLSDLLEVECGYSQWDFWQKVQQEILNYHDQFPELKSRFKQFNLLAHSFPKLCLNRTRLLTQGYADESGNRPGVAVFGRVKNALCECILQPSSNLSTS